MIYFIIRKLSVRGKNKESERKYLKSIEKKILKGINFAKRSIKTFSEDKGDHTLSPEFRDQFTQLISQRLKKEEKSLKQLKKKIKSI